MKPIWTIVANMKEPVGRDPNVVNFKNWDIYTFDKEPSTDDITNVLKYGNYESSGRLRYIKIEKRFEIE